MRWKSDNIEIDDEGENNPDTERTSPLPPQKESFPV